MIHIFKAADGRWAYCPATVRQWPAFSMEGQFESREQAQEALRRDATYAGIPVNVERAGF